MEQGAIGKYRVVLPWVLCVTTDKYSMELPGTAAWYYWEMQYGTTEKYGRVVNENTRQQSMDVWHGTTVK